jgi:hypothetical protein
VVHAVRSILGRRLLVFGENEPWTIRDRILRPDGNPYVAANISSLDISVTLGERLLFSEGVSPTSHVNPPYTDQDVLGALRGAAGQDDPGTWTLDDVGANFLYVFDPDNMPSSIVPSAGGLQFVLGVRGNSISNQYGDFNVYYNIKVEGGNV